MKTRFGWAVGLNVAVACLVMQGCKAPRVTDNNYGKDVKTIEAQPPAAAPAEEIKVAEAPAPAAERQIPEVAPASVAETPAPAAEPEFTMYTVKPGDMLSKISRRYNVRQRAILDLNPGLSPNKLFAGKKIKLPGKIAVEEPAPAVSAAPATAASVSAPKAAKAAKYKGETKTYVVKNGDSLGKIAQECGTNVRTIKELNGLKDNRIFVGKKLKVPAGKTVAKKAAAKKPEAKPAAAAAEKPEPAAAPAQPAAAVVAEPVQQPAEAAAPQVNQQPQPQNEAPAAVRPAAVAQPAAAQPQPQVSTPVPAPVPAPAAVSVQAPAAVSETHTVKEGEDIVSIAISYGVGPGALMEANDLKSSEVKPGDVLKIPAKSVQ